jgi:hypothetical protein
MQRYGLAVVGHGGVGRSSGVDKRKSVCVRACMMMHIHGPFHNGAGVCACLFSAQRSPFVWFVVAVDDPQHKHCAVIAALLLCWRAACKLPARARKQRAASRCRCRHGRG